MKAMTESERDAFLSERRYGILTTNGGNGFPMPVPLWFEWDGTRARLFTQHETAKVRRVRSDARVALLVANHPDEPERWVLIQGAAAVLTDGGWDLAQRLAARYWDLNDPTHAATVGRWEAMADEWVVLEIAPSAILTSAGD